MFDVVIIGGGPAGSTAAALLAAAGRDVVLLEKETFPRFHIGESLLPFNVQLFRRLGVADQIDARFIQKWGAQIFSSDGSVNRYICFADGMVPGHPMAFHVLRSRFDELLLLNAAGRGADVRQAREVVEARGSHRDGWVITSRGADGQTSTLRARFLLDASGRDAFIASRGRLRRMSPHLRKAAVFAHFTGVARDEGRAAGDIILIVLRDGWFWMIPLPDGVTSVGLVAEGSRLKEIGLSPERTLEEALRRCPAARPRMEGSRRVSPVWSASDYSYECRGIAGDGYLLLGDAAAFIDPIFSTGVWLAMSSGELAADALHAALGGGGRAADLSPSVFASYERAVRRHVRGYTRIVSRFYQPGFMDVFLAPSSRFKIKEAVISLLAGLSEPSLPVAFRIWCFYTVVALHRRIGIVPRRVPLLGVLEEASV